MPDAPAARGLVDTSVVIELERVPPQQLPGQIAIAAVTLASSPPGRTPPVIVPSPPPGRLQRAEATFQAIPFDADAARAYGRIYARVTSSGPKARGERALDLLIAATALAADLPLHTRNPSDFDGLEDLLPVIAVTATPPGS